MLSVDFCKEVDELCEYTYMHLMVDRGMTVENIRW